MTFLLEISIWTVILHVDLKPFVRECVLMMVPVHCAITNRVPGASVFPYQGGRICIDNSTFWVQPGVQAHLGTTYMDDTIQWCLAISAGTAQHSTPLLQFSVRELRLRSSDWGQHAIFTLSFTLIFSEKNNRKAWNIICCCLEWTLLHCQYLCTISVWVASYLRQCLLPGNKTKGSTV